MTHVKVRNRKGRGLELVWKDPATGKRRTRALETNRMREAEREAAKLESEINEGTAKRALKTLLELLRSGSSLAAGDHQTAGASWNRREAVGPRDGRTALVEIGARFG